MLHWANKALGSICAMMSTVRHAAWRTESLSRQVQADKLGLFCGMKVFRVTFCHRQPRALLLSRGCCVSEWQSMLFAIQSDWRGWSKVTVCKVMHLIKEQSSGSDQTPAHRPLLSPEPREDAVSRWWEKFPRVGSMNLDLRDRHFVPFFLLILHIEELPTISPCFLLYLNTIYCMLPLCSVSWLYLRKSTLAALLVFQCAGQIWEVAR